MSEIDVGRLTEYSPHIADQLGRLMKFLSDSFSGEPIDEELLSTIIASPYHDQLIARLDGRIVGAATLSLVIGAAAGKKGYLEDFVTDPDVRGQGIGEKVWNEIIKWCSEQGLNLDFTSRPSREEAHRFYRSHGAVVRDTTVFHVYVN